MAVAVDVQKEHGHSPIAHPILEALAFASFSASQLKVILGLIRQTYGWSRRDAAISYSEFVRLTGCAQNTVRRTIGELVDAGVVVIVAPATFQAPTTYRLQKDPRKWGRFACAPLSMGVPAPVESAQFRAPLDGQSTVPTGGQSTVPMGEHSNGSQVVEIATTSEGLKQVKAKESNNNRQLTAAREDLNEDDFVSGAIHIANRGMADNAAIGDRYRPIPTQHGSRQAVHDWLTAGISRHTIDSVVYETAKAYKPTPTNRQISTMKYFDSAVREEHEREATNGITPPQGRAAPSALVPTASTQEIERFERWCRANPAEATQLRAEVERELGNDLEFRRLDRGAQESRIKKECRARVTAEKAS